MKTVCRMPAEQRYRLTVEMRKRAARRLHISSYRRGSGLRCDDSGASRIWHRLIIKTPAIGNQQQEAIDGYQRINCEREAL